MTEENRAELFRQQQLDQQQSLVHKKKQLENFAKDAEHQKRLLLNQEQQLQEQNYEITKNSDIYLRREIELLELDKNVWNYI